MLRDVGRDARCVEGGGMRLADFITKNLEPILVQWEEFAATRLPAAGQMSPLELRDHAQQILEAIVLDLGTTQNPAQQSAKSKGLAPVPFPAQETAAEAHAVLRARSGFDVRQLASEYRALRASVLSLWLQAGPPAPSDLDDMIRFNEAIDQALAESIEHFSAQVERGRELLLGMLSHDMRSPLQTIQITATYLSRLHAGDSVSAAAQRLIDSGRRVQALLDDLTDFNRVNLGVGLPIARSDIDAGLLCAEELARLRVVHPGRLFELSVDGDCCGQWDGRRLQQLVCNLVVNAVKYGAADEAVRIEVVGDDAEIRLEVHNRGPTISAPTLARIFEPLTGGPDTADQPGLGLGLFIVREIARAHGGDVTATSRDGTTVFATRLPKRTDAGRRHG
jgi:signal transduction histidine kinase